MDLTAGELINRYIKDPVAFGLPLLYGRRLPDLNWVGQITAQKIVDFADYDVKQYFAPNTVG